MGKVYVDNFVGVLSNLYQERRFYRCQQDLTQDECKSLLKVISTRDGSLNVETSTRRPSGCYYSGMYDLLMYNQYKDKFSASGNREDEWRKCQGHGESDYSTCYCKQVTEFKYKVQTEGQCQFKLSKDECRIVNFQRRDKVGLVTNTKSKFAALFRTTSTQSVSYPPGCSLYMGSTAWNYKTKTSKKQCSSAQPCLCATKPKIKKRVFYTEGRCAKSLSRDDCQIVIDELGGKWATVTDWKSDKTQFEKDVYKIIGFPEDLVLPKGCVVWKTRPFYSDQDEECSQDASCYCAAENLETTEAPTTTRKTTTSSKSTSRAMTNIASIIEELKASPELWMRWTDLCTTAASNPYMPGNVGNDPHCVALRAAE